MLTDKSCSSFYHHSAKNVSGQLKITRALNVPEPAPPRIPKNIITAPEQATHVFSPFASGAARPAKRRSGDHAEDGVVESGGASGKKPKAKKPKKEKVAKE